MADFTLSATIAAPYDVTVEKVRALLVDAGFGVLTEIDVRATLAAKLGVEVAPRVILGACRPQLAHQALEADPRVATMLPCNVVVTALDDHTTRIEVFDPAAMTSFSDAPALAALAAEARSRLADMLTAVTRETDAAHAASA